MELTDLPLTWPVREDCDREFNVFAVFGVRPELADDEDTKLMLLPKLSDLKNWAYVFGSFWIALVDNSSVSD